MNEQENLSLVTDTRWMDIEDILANVCRTGNLVGLAARCRTERETVETHYLVGSWRDGRGYWKETYAKLTMYRAIDVTFCAHAKSGSFKMIARFGKDKPALFGEIGDFVRPPLEGVMQICAVGISMPGPRRKSVRRDISRALRKIAKLCNVERVNTAYVRGMEIIDPATKPLPWEKQ